MSPLLPNAPPTPGLSPWVAIQFGVYPLALLLLPFFAWWTFEQGLHESLVLLLVGALALSTVFLLERLLPKHTQWAKDQGDTRTDLLHHLHALAIPAIHQGSVALLLLWISPQDAPSFWPHTTPFLLQLLLALLLMDFGTYWGHRLVHRVPWLWRFHQIHHSAQRLYFLNTQRFHPVDLYVIHAFTFIPLLLLGPNVVVVVVASALSMTHALFQHANINLRTRRLDLALSTANLHRWHHAGANAVNFGGVLSVWDRLFKTLGAHQQTPSPEALVQNAASLPKGFRAQLLHPFLSQSRSQRTRS